MSRHPTTLDAADLLGNIADPGIFRDMDDGFEQFWQWPETLGKGSMGMIKLRPGLILGVGQYRLTEKIQVRFAFDYFPVVLSYGLSGSMQCRLSINNRQRNLWSFRQGRSIMTYLPEWQGVVHPPVETSVGCACLYMDPRILDTYLAGQNDWVPPVIRDIAGGTLDRLFYDVSDTSPLVKVILRQILNCPYQGGLRRMFLESKALELIAGSMAQFVPPKKATKNKFTLRSTDIERIHHARTMVSRDFTEPLRLQEIAHAVGLSHPKLNYGFRKIYGATVFGYLRELRLNKAKALLDDGSMNVTEAAFEVGYSSLSYFAKAFKESFGIAPGNYLRQAARQ
jgi:AraC family transcriptional regulator, transcriptional activator of the genes for pyochelin and ferripyochelin receptors